MRIGNIIADEHLLSKGRAKYVFGVTGNFADLSVDVRVVKPSHEELITKIVMHELDEKRQSKER